MLPYVVLNWDKNFNPGKGAIRYKIGSKIFYIEIIFLTREPKTGVDHCNCFRSKECDHTVVVAIVVAVVVVVNS